MQVLIAALRALEQQLHQVAGLEAHTFQSQTLQGMLFKALVPFVDTCNRPRQLLRLLQLPDAYDPHTLPHGRQVLPAPPGLHPQAASSNADKDSESSGQQELDEDSKDTQQQTPCEDSKAGVQQQRVHLHKGVSSEHGLSAVTRASGRPRPTLCHPRHHATRSQPAAEQIPDLSQNACSTAGSAAVGAAGAAGPAPLHLPVEKDAVRLQASGEAEYTADVAAKMGGRVMYLAGA